EHWGRQFYVENVAGAGGNLGMRAAARAGPDGYTLALVSSSFMVNPSLYPHVPYDQAKDFVPVTLPAYAPNVLVASPSLQVKSVEQLAEFVKANPGKLSFASAGMGTTPYLSGELFKLSLGADLVHVPFNGSAPAIQSTLGGHSVRVRRPRASRTAHQGRKPAWACCLERRALLRAARCADDRGSGISRPGGRHLARRAGPRRNAQRDHRSTAPGNRAHRGIARRERAPGCHRFRASGESP